MNEITSKSLNALTFIEKRASDNAYLDINYLTSNAGTCWSYVGYSGGAVQMGKNFFYYYLLKYLKNIYIIIYLKKKY